MTRMGMWGELAKFQRTARATLGDWALTYARKGLLVFPCNLKKEPLTPNGFENATRNEKQIGAWWQRWPTASIGARMGTASGWLAIDVDAKHDGPKYFQVLLEENGGIPQTLRSRTGGGGSHFFFQCRGKSFHSSVGALTQGVDVRAEGSYVILPPSPHPSGNAYKWENAEKVKIADLPEWLEKLLEQRNGNVSPKVPPDRIATGQRDNFLTSQAGSYARRGDTAEIIAAKLKIDYEQRCEQNPPITEKDFRRIAGSIFEKEQRRRAKEENPAVPPIASSVEEAAEPTLKVGSGREDTSNAERFAAQHEHRVRFWHGRGKWLLWTGTHWADDQLAQVFELAKETAKGIFLEAAGLPDDEAKRMGRWAERSLNRDKLVSMLALAQSDPRIAITTESLDSDPYAVNFLNCTVDASTGETRPHQRRDFITKIVRCNYSPDLIGQLWLKYVKETFGDLADWIQKATGYSITGNVREKVVFLLLGKTDTGKTTFLTTLRELFADYSKLLQIETLMWAKHSDNNTAADLADLRGARFVTTSEVEEGQRLREARLKSIVQGMGKIKTARKFENPIEFNETHKIWIDANFAPFIRGTDNAIWHRLLPIPCIHELSESQKDRELKSKLHLEDAAIASWAIAGAMRWFREGLAPIPDQIQKRRGTWMAEMDLIGDFLANHCDEGPGFSVRAGDLFERYRKHGGHLNQTVFGTRMADRGFDKIRESGKGPTIYLGIKLKDML
jgi:putative DNA primase/helicase